MPTNPAKTNGVTNTVTSIDASEATMAAIGIGGGVGGFAEWWRHADAERAQVTAGVILVGLPVFGLLWAGVYTAELSLPLSALGCAVAVGGIIAVPRLVAGRA